VIAWNLSDYKKKMKRLITALGLVALIIGPVACGKHDVGTTLALLRHKWNIVSFNGEAYRYTGKPGDYYDFRADSRLYAYYGGLFDTLVYISINGGKSLQLYNIKGGKRLDGSFELDIEKLSSSVCILHKCQGPPFCVLDSLSR